MIGIAVVELGRMAFDSLMHDRHPEVGPLSIAVMVATLVVNLFVTRIEREQGEKLKSALLMADARHTLSDVGVTLAVLASLGFVWMGYPRRTASSRWR